MEITLTIDKEKVMEQVAATTAYTAAKMDPDSTAFNRISTVDEDVAQIMRSVTDAFSHLKVELGEYLHGDGPTADSRIDKAVESGPELVLPLRLPSNFNAYACDPLGGMLHEYIVNRTLADWFAITVTKDAETYRAKAADALERAKRALYMRRRPMRPTTYTDQ